MNFFRRIWNKLFAKNTTTSEPTPVTPPSDSSDGTILKLDPKVTLGQITGASPGEALMIRKAFEYFITVLRSDFLKPEFMASKFTNTNGKTNEEIYNDYVNSTIVVNVDDFSGNWTQNHVWHTEGYEAGDGFVHANRYFIQDAISMMSLIAHEVGHEPLGYHHDSASELSSVPYSANRIWLSVAAKLGIK